MNRSYFLFRHCIVLAVVFMGGGASYAQDTLRIMLQDAEQQFLQNNLSLLATKYDINMAQAQIIQARLYNNPNIAVSGNLYNPDLKKPFDISNKTGQYVIQVEQLIILAGKRNKQVKMATTQAQMAEYNFYDLLRTLRYSLRSTYYEMLHLYQSKDAYAAQISSLEQLNRSYQELQGKGVVTLKDAVRIQSLLYNLQAAHTSLQNQLNELAGDLQLLLRDNKHVYIPVDMGDTEISLQAYGLQTLVDSAYQNRFDLKAADAFTLYSQQNYQLQKALRTPDLTLGAEFDKRGSFVDNGTFLNAAIDLPFFNRNQGNIKSAQSQIAQSKVLLEQQQQKVENEVQVAYGKVLNTAKMLQGLDKNFRKQFDQLLYGMTDNFQKKNVSLLEFTDLYESWKDHVLQYNQLRNEKAQALEALNFAVGKTLFN